jgi:hypothetical protein
MGTGARADQLVQFDDPSIVAALRSNGVITGYYTGRSDESYLFGRDGTIAICQFVFLGKKRPNRFEIKGWETSLVPASESRIARGTIYVGHSSNDDKWVFQFDEVPNGCRSKKDGDRLVWHNSNYFMEQNSPVLYKEEQGVHARVTKRGLIIGLRVIKSDAAPASSVPESNAISKSPFSVGLGGLVIAIRRRNGFVLVEYIAPKTGEKLSGWIQEKHLKDPFTR